jgi:putative YhbY family RNA-binding protein
VASLTPPERRALQARAHHLRPVVSIGQHGLTAAVLHEIDVNLIAHELVKVRVFDDDRAARDALLLLICAELNAAPVQHIGKLLIVWRPSPEKPKPVTEPSPRAQRPAPKARARQRPHTAPASAAHKAPQARRPRTPLPRSPARPPARGPSVPAAGHDQSRRRRGRRS